MTRALLLASFATTYDMYHTYYTYYTDYTYYTYYTYCTYYTDYTDYTHDSPADVRLREAFRRNPGQRRSQGQHRGGVRCEPTQVSCTPFPLFCSMPLKAKQRTRPGQPIVSGIPSADLIYDLLPPG